jgi:hypothetical protein
MPEPIDSTASKVKSIWYYRITPLLFIYFSYNYLTSNKRDGEHFDALFS